MNFAGSDRCRHLGMSPEVFLESFQTQFRHFHGQVLMSMIQQEFLPI